MTYQKLYYESFRRLNEEEMKRTVEAMKFLWRKGIGIDKIIRLSKFDIDMERKEVKFKYEGKKFVVNRSIGYDDSPLESQIEAMEDLRSECFVFPKGVWDKRKKKIFVVPLFEENEARELLNLPLKKDKKLLQKKENKVIINLSI